MFGRQPVAWTTAFAGIVNFIVLMYNAFKPETAPQITVEMVSALNVAFAGIIALVANVTATPVNDARLANGTQVNSGQSVVVPANVLTDVAVPNVITPVSSYPEAPKVGGA